MGEVQWIKIYIDMFDKRKIKKVRRLPAGNDLLLIWIMLLAMAGKCNAGGHIFITENIPFTEEDLADELDFEVKKVTIEDEETKIEKLTYLGNKFFPTEEETKDEIDRLLDVTELYEITIEHMSGKIVKEK